MTIFDGVLPGHEIVAEKNTFEAGIQFTAVDVGMVKLPGTDSDSSFVSFLPI